MPTIKVTASLNTKLKFFSDFENINPHSSITIEREMEGTDEELLEYADGLYDKARKVVEKKINSDIQSAKGGKGIKKELITSG